jgi:hypothetical protein
VTDDRLPDVRAAAGAEPAAEVGWEPSDWAACLRRERRKQLASVTGLVVLVGVVGPVLGSTVLDWSPNLGYLLPVTITLIFVAETVISFVSATDRARWEREAREEVRIRHALRHHTGIGAADRALVTERARAMVTLSKVAFVGWPLLAVALVGRSLEVADPPASLIMLVIVACLLLVARAVQRFRRARRWLADPLPRDERTP